jgi:hypothetical protein
MIQLKAQDIQGKWRSLDVDTVIDYYKENPMIWDSSMTTYRDRTHRKILLEKLVRLLNYRKTGV